MSASAQVTTGVLYQQPTDSVLANLIPNSLDTLTCDQWAPLECTLTSAGDHQSTVEVSSTVVKHAAYELTAPASVAARIKVTMYASGVVVGYLYHQLAAATHARVVVPALYTTSVGSNDRLTYLRFDRVDSNGSAALVRAVAGLVAA